MVETDARDRALPHAFMQSMVNEVSKNAYVYNSPTLGLELDVSYQYNDAERVRFLRWWSGIEK